RSSRRARTRSTTAARPPSTSPTACWRRRRATRTRTPSTSRRRPTPSAGGRWPCPRPLPRRAPSPTQARLPRARTRVRPTQAPRARATPARRRSSSLAGDGERQAVLHLGGVEEVRPLVMVGVHVDAVPDDVAVLVEARVDVDGLVVPARREAVV